VAKKTPRKTAAATKAMGAAATPTMARKRRVARPEAKTTASMRKTTSVTTSAPRKSKRRKITPEAALATTRELLEAKQARDRQPPPWRQFEAPHGQSGAGQHHGYDEQQAAAEAKAGVLHAAESRMEAIQGSISTQDRHAQGRRDAKG